MAPDEPADDEPPLTEPVPAVPDSDELLDEPVDGEPDADEPLAPLDEPLRPPLLPAPLEPMLPVEPLAGLALDDAPPDMLPDEPALACEPVDEPAVGEPVVLLFRLLD
ncbi:hypothetical protein [Massilia sp. CFBP 13721]|nr:hypothetical protein [Massilia sp. CFBP 13721]